MATFTLSQYNALVSAIASGATRVKYSDKEVEYRSLAEMRALLNDMALDLGITQNAAPQRTVGLYCSGLGNETTVEG